MEESEITAYNGDCLKIMTELPDASIDCFICDLPYGCLTTQNKKNTNKEEKQYGCEWDIKINLTKFWEQVKRLSKNEHTPVIMFCTTKFGYELIKSNESWFRYDLVWDKKFGVSFLSANRMPMRSHEMCYVFSKAGAAYQRVDIADPTKKEDNRKPGIKVGNVYQGKKPIYVISNKGGVRCALSIIPISNTARKGNHPTEKPLKLYEWLIERYSKPGNTILDPTAGSFNCCIQARAMNRNSIGIEMDKTFYDKACTKIGLE